MDKYCSPKFKTGEELDKALLAALTCCDEATRAEAAATRAEEAAKKAEENGTVTPVASESVLYIEQELSEEQKAQARENIGAMAVGAQPDFSQNDETQPDYVKGRTHWKKVTGEDREIIPETVATISMFGYQYAAGSKAGIAEGVTYIVTWNGVEHTCVGKKGDGSTNYIGNDALYDTSKEDTGEPFCISTLYGYSKYQYSIYGEEGATVTVKVDEKQVVEWHKLERGYLPDDLGDVKCWDDLDGKPFSAESVSEEIMPATTLALKPAVGWGYATLTQEGVYYDLPVGKVCTVVWGGVEYQCEVKEFVYQSGGSGGVIMASALGNVDIMYAEYPPHNNEPFGIVCVIDRDGNRVTDFMAQSELESVTVAIRHDEEVVNHLDEMFLPESVGSVVLRSSTPGSSKKFKLTINDSGTISIVEV